MNTRQAQDVVLGLLADGPLRAAMLAGSAGDPAIREVFSRADGVALDRFGRFLCRHYYRERVVHFFKYSRAVAGLTGRVPEAALKSAEFNALMPRLILGEHGSARRVLEMLQRHLLAQADSARAAVPYWDDLIRYQSVFFLSDALPPVREEPAPRYTVRAESATILELEWDLPPILPQLLRPFERLPMPRREPTRLLYARSREGEVTVLRCTDALRDLLENLTGDQPPAEIAARLGLDAASFEKAMQRLEQLGAVIGQGAFSASHVESDLPPASASTQ